MEASSSEHLVDLQDREGIWPVYIPFRCRKFSEKVRRPGNPLTVPVSQCRKGSSSGVMSTSNQIYSTIKLDCLPEASLPGIIRQQHWSWEEQRGFFVVGCWRTTASVRVGHKLNFASAFRSAFAFLSETSAPNRSPRNWLAIVSLYL